MQRKITVRCLLATLVLVLISMMMILPFAHADSYQIPTYNKPWATSTITVTIPSDPGFLHNWVARALVLWNQAQLWFAAKYFPGSPVYTFEESDNGLVLVFFRDSSALSIVCGTSEVLGGCTEWWYYTETNRMSKARVTLSTSGGVDFEVVLHEFGHVLGLDHVAHTGNACYSGDLMCHFSSYDASTNPSTLDLYAIHLLITQQPASMVTLPSSIPYGQAPSTYPVPEFSTTIPLLCAVILFSGLALTRRQRRIN